MEEVWQTCCESDRQKLEVGQPRFSSRFSQVSPTGPPQPPQPPQPVHPPRPLPVPNMYLGTNQMQGQVPMALLRQAGHIESRFLFETESKVSQNSFTICHLNQAEVRSSGFQDGVDVHGSTSNVAVTQAAPMRIGVPPGPQTYAT